MFNPSIAKKQVQFSVLGKSLVVGFKQEKLCFSFLKERLDMNPLIYEGTFANEDFEKNSYCHLSCDNI